MKLDINGEPKITFFEALRVLCRSAKTNKTFFLIVIIVYIIGLLLFIYFFIFFPTPLPDPESVASQLTKLNSLSSSLKELDQFLQTQKTKIIEQERLVKDLEDEQRKLEPVVTTNRAVVESFFQVMEDRQQTKVWRERLIGFLFGILASVLGTLILRFFPRKQKGDAG